MTETANALAEGDKAYIKMLELHFTQTSALLSDIGGSKPGEPMASRELALAYTGLEQAYLYAREHILRRHMTKAKLN